MLTITDLCKTYDNGVRALNAVSLDIGTGMFGLLGPNGAGKSSLMRTVATLQQPDRGSITFAGRDVLAEPHELRKILGYLPQDFGVYPKVTAAAMLDHLAMLKGLAGRGERRDAVDGLLHMTNLWAVRDQKLGTFSGGMRQRFGIAQALLGDPRLIIVDEPTAGLDPEERQRFLNLLSAIGDNVAVILSTHIVDDVSELCTAMAIIARGEVQLADDPRAVVAALDGTIWRRVVDRAEVAAVSARVAVISTRLAAGRTVLHAVADERPDDGFEAVAATLEDAYFATLRRAERRAA